MGLDIRIPIGLLFSTLGVLLTITGLVTDKAIYARSLNIDVNLWWGLVMIAFGALMLFLGWRGMKSPRDGKAGDGRGETKAAAH